MRTCPKCGTKRMSFEEMFVHICSCTGMPKATETTEQLSVKDAVAASYLKGDDCIGQAKTD